MPNLRGPLGLRRLNLETVGHRPLYTEVYAWALHAGSSCHQRAPEANGALIKCREEPTEVE